MRSARAAETAPHCAWYDSAMNERALQVQTLVRQKVAHLGRQGEKWLAELPDLIAHLEREWAIVVGQPLTGGTASYVAHARTADGQDAVLKIAIPAQSFAGEVRAIASAQGRGYVGLLAYDVERHAMLQEALGPSIAQLALPPEQAISVLCQTLSQAWAAASPVGLTVTPADEK